MRYVVLIEGPEAEQVFNEMISNAEYDRLNAVIWTADTPEQVQMNTSTLIYMPNSEEK